MSELIDRYAAIDAIRKLSQDNGYIDMPHEYVTDVIRALPSAQAEERTNKHTETHAYDCISRQAAIHLIAGYDGVMDKSVAKRLLIQLPSAQPSGKDPIEREAVVDILHDAMQGCSESEEDLIGDIVSKVDLLPSAQPDRSLWFRIGEICVDESKGFISSGRAVGKIRELLREAERREDG